MKKSLMFGVILMCILSTSIGVFVAMRTTPTPSKTYANDFTPPNGRATNPPPNSAGERRVNIATSTDGITFTPTGETLTDQANVPDAVVTDDGTIFVYYIGQGITEHEEDVAVAISKDNGNTWTYHLPTFANLPNPRPPSDPDVVLLENGTFRMFYTCDFGPGSLGIRYADSEDGITFTHKGIALHPTTNVIDSTTFLVDDVWTMLVLDETDPKQYVATSTDGKTFTLQGETGTFIADEASYILSNPIPGLTPVTLLGFGDLDHNNLRTFSTEDGTTWNPSSTISLEPTTSSLRGGTYLQDVTIAKISDGSYLLFYVTDIPKE